MLQLKLQFFADIWNLIDTINYAIFFVSMILFILYALSLKEMICEFVLEPSSTG